MAESSLPHSDYKSYLSEPEACCSDFIMQQTMMRIRDPKVSLDFYSRILGMRSVQRRSMSTLTVIYHYVLFLQAVEED